QHRPEVVDRSAQALDCVLDEVAGRVRMVEPELVPVGVEPLLAEKQACPGMMQARVVQYDESWICDEIRPHVVVERRVAELIDDEIVRCAAMLPDEIVRPRFREAIDGEL